MNDIEKMKWTSGGGRIWIVLLGCLLGAGVNGLAEATDAASRRPNTIFIAADDPNMWVGPLGFNRAQTPNLDRLAAREVTLTNAQS